MIGGCYKEGEKDKEWDRRCIVRTTDRFSEILFELTKIDSQLDACSDAFHDLRDEDWMDGYRTIWKQLERAEEAINRKAKEWAGDKQFQAEVKIRLEVLRLQKKYIEDKMEHIKRSLRSLLVSFEGLNGKEEE